MAANIPKHVTSVPEGSLTATPPSLQGWREPLKPGNSRCKGHSHWEDLELALGDKTFDLPSLFPLQA